MAKKTAQEQSILTEQEHSRIAALRAAREQRTRANSVKLAVKSLIDPRQVSGYDAADIQHALDLGLIIEIDGQLALPPAQDCGAQATSNLPAQDSVEPGAAITESGAAINSPLAIDAEIKRCQQSEDPSLRAYAYDLVIGFGIATDWLTDGLDETPRPPRWPHFPGLKLRNESKALESGYLFFTGIKSAVLSICRELGRAGLAPISKPLGINGQYSLVIDLKHAGELLAA